MSEKVRHHFVDVLADIFGAPPNTDGLTARLAGLGKDLSEGQVKAAAERLAKRHKGPKFPPYADCCDALRGAASTAMVVAESGTVTAQNFADRAVAFGRQNGIHNGEYPVIFRDHHPKEWWAWQCYYRHIGMKAAASRMRTDASVTVPAYHPSTFDMGFAPPPMPEPMKLSEERLARLQLVSGALLQDMRKGKPRNAA